MSERLHILLLGCGKMGSAMLRGWLNDTELDAHFTIIEPFEAAVSWLPKVGNIRHYPDIQAASAAELAPVDFALLAVKPQMMEEAAADLRQLTHDETAYLSVAAGLSASWLAHRLGSEARILRAMPNTPAAVGAGITALYATNQVSAAQVALATKLLGAIGEVVHLPEESLIDAVTALSGSGPAYVFKLVEVMADAGQKLGLPDAMAQKLARQTVIGAGALMQAVEDDAATLRQNVTSKGGTTAAALAVLDADEALARLLAEAMQAAHDRSVELGG